MNRKSVLKPAAGKEATTSVSTSVSNSIDAAPTSFPSATPYQLDHSAIDDLAAALEERRSPDRRVADIDEPRCIERRKTQRRKPA